MTLKNAAKLCERLRGIGLLANVYELDEYYVIFISFIGYQECYAKKTEEIVLLAGDDWQVTGMVICKDYNILITPK